MGARQAHSDEFRLDAMRRVYAETNASYDYVHRIWKTYDADGNNFLDKKELKNFVKDILILQKHVQADVTPVVMVDERTWEEYKKHISLLYKEIDTDGDGQISFLEFWTYFGKTFCSDDPASYTKLEVCSFLEHGLPHKVMAYLESGGDPILEGALLLNAARHNHVEVLNKLLELKAFPEKEHISSYTLSFCINNGVNDFVYYYLDNGGDKEVQIPNGNLLCSAAAAGDPELFKILYEKYEVSMNLPELLPWSLFGRQCVDRVHNSPAHPGLEILKYILSLPNISKADVMRMKFYNNFCRRCAGYIEHYLKVINTNDKDTFEEWLKKEDAHEIFYAFSRYGGVTELDLDAMAMAFGKPEVVKAIKEGKAFRVENYTPFDSSWDAVAKESKFGVI